MKKQYTKRQIQEAIAYWERQLRERLDMQPNYIKEVYQVIVLKDGRRTDVYARIFKRTGGGVIDFLPADQVENGEALGEFVLCDEITAGDVACFPEYGRFFATAEDIDECRYKSARARFDFDRKTVTYSFT